MVQDCRTAGSPAPEDPTRRGSRPWLRRARRRAARVRPVLAGAPARRVLLAVALPTLLLPASAHADADVRFLNACPGDGAGTLDIVRGARSIETHSAAFGKVSA